VRSTGFGGERAAPNSARSFGTSKRLGGLDYSTSFDVSSNDYGATKLGASLGGIGAVPVPPEQRMVHMLSAGAAAARPISLASIRSGGFGSTRFESRPATRA